MTIFENDVDHEALALDEEIDGTNNICCQTRYLTKVMLNYSNHKYASTKIFALKYKTR